MPASDTSWIRVPIASLLTGLSGAHIRLMVRRRQLSKWAPTERTMHVSFQELWDANLISPRWTPHLRRSSERTTIETLTTAAKTDRKAAKVKAKAMAE